MSVILESIKGGLVVSCQASPGDPLEDTETMRRIAGAAIGGGASGLRLNSAEHVAAIRRETSLPIIGIQKEYRDGRLRITPDFRAASQLAAAGASIIALDCTSQTWHEGDPWQECIARIHNELRLPVMADIATEAEALAAAAAGADMIGTTLNGYTPETRGHHNFNWDLLRDLVKKIDRPVIAEGHISTPAQAGRAIAGGAWSVVVGSAITRPGTITAQFVKGIKRWSGFSPAIGVDVGGTSVKAGLVDHTGQVSLLQRIPTRAKEGRAAIVSAINLAVQNIVASAQEREIVPIGLGIASAGAIDPHNGTIFAATENLPEWAEFDLRTFGSKSLHLPTYVYNDAQAAALAELHFGMGRGLSNFVAITLGTGVGGGVIAEGQLIRGHLGFAGTLGHQTIHIDGLPCNCGRRGCLEAYVSTAGLVREYRALPSGDGSAFTGEDAECALRISRLASAGDRHALQAYTTLAGYLAEGAANIFNILDPEAIFLSGGLVEGHPIFAEQLEERVTRLLHFGAKRKPRVLMSAAGQYAGLQGAAAAVFAAENERI